MKLVLAIVFFVSCSFASAQTYVTSNRDGSPDNHAIPDTSAIQPYAVSSKRFIGIGKNADIICTPVKLIFQEKTQPVKVSSEKFKLEK